MILTSIHLIGKKNIVDAYKNKVDLEKFHSVDDEITYESHKNKDMVSVKASKKQGMQD